MKPVLSSIMSTENYQTYDRQTKDFCAYERNRLQQIKTNQENKIRLKKQNYNNAQSVLIDRIPVEINDLKKIEQLKQNILREDPIKYKNLNGVSVINPITQQYLGQLDNENITIYNQFQTKKRDQNNPFQMSQNQNQELNLMQSKKRSDNNQQIESKTEIQLFQQKRKSTFNDKYENEIDRQDFTRKKRVDEYFENIQIQNRLEKDMFQHKRQIDSYQDYIFKLQNQKEKQFSQKQRNGFNQAESKDFPFQIQQQQQQQDSLYKQFQSKIRNNQHLSLSMLETPLFQTKCRNQNENTLKDIHQDQTELSLMQGKKQIPQIKNSQEQNDSLVELMQSKKRDANYYQDLQNNSKNERELFKSKKRIDNYNQDFQDQEIKLFQSKIKQSQKNLEFY